MSRRVQAKKCWIYLISSLVALFSLISVNAYAVTDQLDYGLYWLGHGELKQKFVEGVPNQFYDPAKPVMLFIHGWQPGTSQNNYEKENLYFDRTGQWTQDPWIDKGWNVGIFYWSQWADEDMVGDAEAKIWSRSGPQGFRYRLSDGSYSTALNPPGSGGAAMLAYKDFVAALADNTSGNIRLVGHSLGNQMVTALAEIVYDNIVAGKISESRYRIKRIALLDPAWTAWGKSYLGDSNNDGRDDWVGERCRWAIFKMIDRWTNVNDFSVEIYNTTALDQNTFGVMDANNPLRRRVAGTISVRPWYYFAWQLSEKHCVIPKWYFASMEFSAPSEVTLNWLNQRILTGAEAASAATPDWRIKQMMGDTYEWDQVEGRYTETPADDWFARKAYHDF